MTSSIDELLEFEKISRKHFGFLYDSKMQNRPPRRVGGSDPRDSAVVIRFFDSELQIEIGWSHFELSLAVLIKYERSDLKGGERYIYFEPFVEFLTHAREKAIVPYMTENMSVRIIESVMDERQTTFSSGLDSVAEKLGGRLQSYLIGIRSATNEQVAAYHKWMSSAR